MPILFTLNPSHCISKEHFSEHELNEGTVPILSGVKSKLKWVPSIDLYNCPFVGEKPVVYSEHINITYIIINVK